MRRDGQSGFTLLEVLVALVVLGLLIAGLTQGMRLGVGLWQSESQTLAMRADVDAMEKTLRVLVSRIDPGGVSGRAPPFEGTARSMLFTTTLPESAGAMPTPEADVALGVDREHQLQVLWQPRYRSPIRPTPPSNHVALLRDVDHLEIAYWRDAATGWRQEWRGPPLPQLIRIRVVFHPGSKQHGPDIVIRPMRAQWRQ
jgi:general secretion pathway protein J